MDLSLITISKLIKSREVGIIKDVHYLIIAKTLIKKYKEHVLKTHICDRMTCKYVNYDRTLFRISEEIMQLCSDFTWIRLIKSDITHKTIFNVLTLFKEFKQNVEKYDEHLYTTTKRNAHVYNYVCDRVFNNLSTVIEILEEQLSDKCVYEWIQLLNVLCKDTETLELKPSISITELKNSYKPYRYDMIQYIPGEITLYLEKDDCDFPYTLHHSYNKSSQNTKNGHGIIYNCHDELLDFADYVENYNHGDTKEQIEFFEKHIREYMQRALYIPYHCIKYMCNTYKKKYNIYEKGVINDHKTIIDWHGLVLYIRNTLSKRKFIMRYTPECDAPYIKCLELI